jgi:crotonobetainyl-CoA:carnitine CoA-transferase CaiB-like acyl-CoA transferase
MIYEVAAGEYVHTSVMSGLTPLKTQDEIVGVSDPMDPVGRRDAYRSWHRPQLVDNDMVAEVDDPDLGPTVQIGVPIHLLGTPGGIRGPRPRPGEHNAEIFGELGYTAEEIAVFTGGAE